MVPYVAMLTFCSGCLAVTYQCYACCSDICTYVTKRYSLLFAEGK